MCGACYARSYNTEDPVAAAAATAAAAKKEDPVAAAAAAAAAAGIGGFLARIFGGAPAPVVMASVPLRLALTVDAAAGHPTAGAAFRQMLDSGELDERMAVMMLLVLERRRGDRSPIKPYIDALPAEFHTPLFYSAEEMEGLRGTNLHAAVMTQRRQLAGVLTRSVQPAADKLFAALRAGAYIRLLQSST
jgi:hypothetical protein